MRLGIGIAMAMAMIPFKPRKFENEEPDGFQISKPLYLSIFLPSCSISTFCHFRQHSDISTESTVKLLIWNCLLIYLYFFFHLPPHFFLFFPNSPQSQG